MRIHRYNDRDSDYPKEPSYDVSIGGSGFGITVDIPEWEYSDMENIIQDYNDLQEKLQKLYDDEMNRMRYPKK